MLSSSSTLTRGITVANLERERERERERAESVDVRRALGTIEGVVLVATLF